MVKKVRVSLHGFQNRGVMVDADATEGAVLGKNLYWADGTLVTADDIRSIVGDTAENSPKLDELQNYLNYLLANQGEGGTGGGSSGPYPIHSDVVLADTPLTIPNDYQYLLWQEITVNDELLIEDGGELVLLDADLPALKGPDMSYTAGDLTQIDYDDGSQKILSYTNGNLTRVDLIRDGWTLRKDLYYDLNGDLDYIDPYYV